MKNAVQTMLAIGICMGSSVVAMDAGEALFTAMPDDLFKDEVVAIFRKITRCDIIQSIKAMNKDFDFSPKNPARMPIDHETVLLTAALKYLPTTNEFDFQIVGDAFDENIEPVLAANPKAKDFISKAISTPQPSAPVPAPMHSHDCTRPPSRCD
jgi:hypothetical protein